MLILMYDLSKSLVFQLHVQNLEASAWKTKNQSQMLWHALENGCQYCEACDMLLIGTKPQTSSFLMFTLQLPLSVNSCTHI